MPEPIIDPTTGEPRDDAPPGNGGDPSPQMMTVPTEEWTAIKTKLDVFEKMGGNFGRREEPSAPPAPSGPTLADQVKEIDAQIAVYNTKIDEALAEQKPVSALLSERDALTHRKTRLQIKAEDIDPAFFTGAQTIESLSDRVTRGDMKYLDIVKDDFERSLKQLPPEQRMNPEVRKTAYNLAVGQNMDKIMAAQQEELLRKASPPADGAPSDKTSRSTGSKSGSTPKPKDVLSRDALKAIEAIGKTPDEYYRSRGYEGWNDFWEKRGKSYFGDTDE